MELFKQNLLSPDQRNFRLNRDTNQSKKDTPQPRAKEKLQQDGRRGAAAAAAKSLQSCPTLCDLIDGNPSGSPVPGFSRQEHWSGLPFPSPMHESEKWKWSCKTHSIIAFSTILSPFSAIFLSLNSNSQPYLYGITFHLVFFFLHIAHQTKWLSVWRTSYNVLYLSWYQA